MKSIKELIENKPSKAVQAMLDGLLEQSKRSDFEIHMSSFGIADNKICYGCAATCTVQKLAKKNLTIKNIDTTESRAAKLKFDFYELHEFELAIDDLREGDPTYLFSFCKVQAKYPIDPDFTLNSDDWQEQIPQIETYIKKLQDAGY